MSTSKGAQRPDDDYPTLEHESYAKMLRRRREENRRSAEIAREMASARKADRSGMDELWRRLADIEEPMRKD